MMHATRRSLVLRIEARHGNRVYELPRQLGAQSSTKARHGRRRAEIGAASRLLNRRA
jgi:hypothetical protein